VLEQSNRWPERYRRVYKGPGKADQKHGILMLRTTDGRTHLLRRKESGNAQRHHEGITQREPVWQGTRGMDLYSSHSMARPAPRRQERFTIVDVTPSAIRHLKLPGYWAIIFYATIPCLKEKECEVDYMEFLPYVMGEGKECEVGRVPGWRRHSQKRKSQFLIWREGYDLT
jgi:hypothetical protein